MKLKHKLGIAILVTPVVLMGIIGAIEQPRQVLPFIFLLSWIGAGIYLLVSD